MIQSYISVAKRIEDLNGNNVSEIADSIREEPIVQDQNKIHYLFNILLSLSISHPWMFQPILNLFSMLTNVNNPQNRVSQALKKCIIDEFLSEMTQRYTKKRYVTMLFLRELYLSKQISEGELYNILYKFYTDPNTSSSHLLIIMSYHLFYNGLFDENFELYKLYEVSMKFLNIRSRTIFPEYASPQEIANCQFYIKQIYKIGTLEYYIYNDDVDVITELAAKPEFKFPEKVILSPYDPIDIGYVDAISTLSFTAMCGAEKCFRFFLLTGIFNPMEDSGYSPIICAISGGHIDILRLCQQNRFPLNGSLQSAVEHDSDGVVQWLLMNFTSDPDYLTKMFTLSITKRRYLALSAFLESGLDVDTGLNNSSMLHRAIVSGDEDLFEFALDCGCNKFLRNNDGNTPFLLAAGTPYLGFVEALLPLDNINDTNNNGENCVTRAATLGSYEVLDYLIKKGGVIKEEAFAASLKRPSINFLKIILEQNYHFNAENVVRSFGTCSHVVMEYIIKNNIVKIPSHVISDTLVNAVQIEQTNIIKVLAPYETVGILFLNALEMGKMKSISALAETKMVDKDLLKKAFRKIITQKNIFKAETMAALLDGLPNEVDFVLNETNSVPLTVKERDVIRGYLECNGIVETTQESDSPKNAGVCSCLIL